MNCIDKPKNMKRILIIETNGTGHRLYYVRLLVEAALARGDYLALGLSAESAKCDEYDLHLRRYESEIDILNIELSSLHYIESLAKDFNADLTIIPDGDRLAVELAKKQRWQGRGKLTLLIMRERSQNVRSSARKMAVNFLKKEIFKAASRVKNTKVVILKSSVWNAKSAFPTAQDPVTLDANDNSVDKIKKDWRLDSSLHWFGIFGNIDERKNVALIAQSIGLLKLPSVGLLIAGQCRGRVLDDAELHLNELRSMGVEVRIVNRMLTDMEIDSAISAVNTAVLAHSNESPSGIMGKAAMAGTDIVASGARALRDDAGMIPQNALWSPLRAEDLSNAFRTSMARTSLVLPLEGLGDKQFTDELLSMHS